METRGLDLAHKQWQQGNGGPEVSHCVATSAMGALSAATETCNVLQPSRRSAPPAIGGGRNVCHPSSLAKLPS